MLAFEPAEEKSAVPFGPPSPDSTTCNFCVGVIPIPSLPLGSKRILSEATPAFNVLKTNPPDSEPAVCEVIKPDIVAIFTSVFQFGPDVVNAKTP